MSYAVRKDGQGWRAVNSPGDIAVDEYFSEVQPAPADDQWKQFQAKAQAALDKTDGVALRCWKAGVAFPQAWQDYTNNLRSIVRTTTGDPTQTLPVQPDFPSGT